MNVAHSVDQRKVRTKPLGQRFRRVPCDRKAATFLRAIRCECRDDRRATSLENLAKTRNVLGLIVGSRQEVENGTIVPDVYRWRRPLGGDVGFNPQHFVGRISEPCSSSLKRCARYVQDTDAFDAACEQVIHQAGVPPANVEDSGMD